MIIDDITEDLDSLYKKIQEELPQTNYEQTECKSRVLLALADIKTELEESSELFE